MKKRERKEQRNCLNRTILVILGINVQTYVFELIVAFLSNYVASYYHWAISLRCKAIKFMSILGVGWANEGEPGANKNGDITLLDDSIHIESRRNLAVEPANADTVSLIRQISGRALAALTQSICIPMSSEWLQFKKSYSSLKLILPNCSKACVHTSPFGSITGWS